jgi:hypothetical protein
MIHGVSFLPQEELIRGGARGDRRHQARKAFFFEKEKQKTFAPARLSSDASLR